MSGATAVREFTTSEEGGSSMSPAYEVTAVWIERYCASLCVEASSEEEARRMGREVWHQQPFDFFLNASFSTTRLLGFEAEPSTNPRHLSSGTGFPQSE
jgi:hypothetical protein